MLPLVRQAVCRSRGSHPKNRIRGKGGLGPSELKRASLARCGRVRASPGDGPAAEPAVPERASVARGLGRDTDL